MSCVLPWSDLIEHTSMSHMRSHHGHMSPPLPVLPRALPSFTASRGLRRSVAASSGVHMGCWPISLCKLVPPSPVRVDGVAAAQLSIAPHKVTTATVHPALCAHVRLLQRVHHASQLESGGAQEHVVNVCSHAMALAVVS